MIQLIGPWEIRRKFRYVIVQGHLLGNCPNMNVSWLHWCSVNIGLGNGLVPSHNVDPDLWRHMASLVHDELTRNGKPCQYQPFFDHAAYQIDGSVESQSTLQFFGRDWFHYNKNLFCLKIQHIKLLQVRYYYCKDFPLYFSGGWLQ